MKDKISFAESLYQLTEVEAIYEQPDRAVYTAQSALYGPVILKISNYIQLKEEYEMLAWLNGNGCCRVYDYDERNGFLIEERVIPGTVLRKAPDLSHRILALKDVFHKIHKKPTDIELNGRKTYLDWLMGINSFFANNDLDHTMTKRVNHAKEICEEIFCKYPERCLLHGDLHHDNILRQKNGTYAMIDPKGVIGPEILDLPRFIMNEIDTEHNCTDEDHMTDVVHLVSKTFEYPIVDVAKVYFMEVVLGNAWCMEDGDAINEAEIVIAEKILKDIPIKTSCL